jgi:hypothetical protein
MKKIIIAMLIIMLLGACKSEEPDFMCNQFIDYEDASTDILFISVCTDSDGLHQGLLNANNEYVLSPKHTIIDLGYPQNKLEFVIDNDIQYLRVMDKNDEQINYGIYERSTGIILDVEYQNLYIDHTNKMAYYTNSTGYYMMDLVSKTVETIEFFVIDSYEEYLIFLYNDRQTFSVNGEDIEVPYVEAEVLYIDSDYYLYMIDRDIYLYNIPDNTSIYHTVIDESIPIEKFLLDITPINNDYIMCLSISGGYCYEYHKLLSGATLNNYSGDYSYISEEHILIKSDRTVYVYDLEFNEANIIYNVEQVVNSSTLLLPHDDGYALFNLVNSNYIPITYNSPYLENYYTYDGISGIIEDGSMKIYDENFELIAEVTSSNARWFRENEDIIIVVEDLNDIRTYGQNIVVLSCNSCENTLSTTEFYYKYFRSSQNDDIEIYVHEGEVFAMESKK